ncbi:PAS domain-containing sensor histidine kinase [Albibacterium sp.]|uniref:PAS domain-containing sensor histidine kinase n=1 Tax=Albibacterium sp. TaxID=2952885 RepID=UPI002D1579FB|nr:PAS domain-containing sensor histidine kinase [Albibacterium sp.]HUH19134.1 PAS domain-containing sensor histidine kinase [Albibacterium sp.]
MESAKLLKAVIENSNEGIITIDDSGIVETINPSALRLFNYTAEEVIGNNISMLMPEPYKSQHDEYINKYLSTGKKKIIGIGREVLGQKKNGSTFPFWLSISEVNYENRKIFTGFVQDLSKQKEAEEMLRLYTEELEEVIRERTADLHTMVKRLEDAKDNVTKSLQKEKDLNRLKSQFVSMASHEFRTPLGSVQLSASLINKYAEKNDIEGVHKHTLKIRNSVDLLTNILNDFLSLDRLEGGVIEPHPKSFNIVKFSEEIIEEMQSMTKQNQNIVYQHTGNIGTVYLDPHLLKNAIINLISNAIKYSGENTFIEFNTYISSDKCIIEVKDDGIGIPEADQKHLLEPFFRANNTGKIPGTGLGLNIVKQYAHLMNGEITWISKLDEGTTFILIFKQ